MEFVSSNFQIILIASGLLLLFFSIRMFRTPSSHSNERKENINQKVESIGGTLIDDEDIIKAIESMNEFALT